MFSFPVHKNSGITISAWFEFAAGFSGNKGEIKNTKKTR